jgi:hypothetical protein
MRVLLVIALLVGATIIILFALTDLARDLLRYSHQAAPDLDDSDDWDVAADEFPDAAPPVVSYTEQWAVGRYPITRARGDNIPGSSEALDDLRSAL